MLEGVDDLESGLLKSTEKVLGLRKLAYEVWWMGVRELSTAQALRRAL